MNEHLMVVVVLGFAFLVAVGTAGLLAWLTRKMEPEYPRLRSRCPSCDERWFGDICQCCGYPERLRANEESRKIGGEGA